MTLHNVISNDADALMQWKFTAAKKQGEYPVSLIQTKEG